MEKKIAKMDKEEISSLFDDVINYNSQSYNYGEITSRQKRYIDELFGYLTVDSGWDLFQNRNDCRKAGKKVRGIHPFTTWEYFLEEEWRHNCLHKIEQGEGRGSDPVTRWAFRVLREKSLQGFAIAFRERHQKEDLLSHLKDFCKKTSLPQKEIKSFIELEQWEEMVLFMIRPKKRLISSFQVDTDQIFSGLS